MSCSCRGLNLPSSGHVVKLLLSVYTLSAAWSSCKYVHVDSHSSTGQNHPLNVSETSSSVLTLQLTLK